MLSQGALSSWWKRVVLREPPLVRTPSTGRPRTYSADSGYVYQYTFIGFRRIGIEGEPVSEYLFQLTTGRSPVTDFKIVLRETVLGACVPVERDLTASEKYGVAKLALKRALDRFEHPAAIPGEFSPDETELAEIGEILDL